MTRNDVVLDNAVMNAGPEDIARLNIIHINSSQGCLIAILRMRRGTEGKTRKIIQCLFVCCGLEHAKEDGI
jgi:hypothetical protein